MRFSKRISQMDTSDLRNVLALTARPDIISFAGGLPAPEAFPVEAMPPFVQGLAAAFPLRHYYLMYVQEAIFASGFGGWYMQVVYMLMFLFLPAVVYKRLHRAYRLQNFPRN